MMRNVSRNAPHLAPGEYAGTLKYCEAQAREGKGWRKVKGLKAKTLA